MSNNFNNLNNENQKYTTKDVMDELGPGIILAHGLKEKEYGKLKTVLPVKEKEWESDKLTDIVKTTGGLIDYLTKDKVERFCSYALNRTDSQNMFKACESIMNSRDYLNETHTNIPNNPKFEHK